MKKKKNRPTQDSGHDDPGQEAPPAGGGESAVPAAEAPPTAHAGTQVDWKDRCLRAKADFANLQRRCAEEQRAAVRYANGEFARALLDICDDLDRTLEAAGNDTAEPLLQGVKLVHGKFLKILRDHHIEPIEALGQPFDPNFHEALMQQPSQDHEPNTVLQEVQTGYKLYDRVLRPTRVIVSKPAEPIEAEAQGQSED